MIQGHGDDAYRYGRPIRANFSSNVYGHVDLAPLKAHLRARLDAIGNYPEPEPYTLEKALADRLGLDPAAVCVTSGATEAIYLTAHAFAGSQTAILQPTFSEYADACALYNHHLIPHARQNLFRPGTSPVLKEPAAPPGPRATCWLCNPNNPTGIGMNKDKLQRWIDYANENKSVLLYDGAYEKFISHGNLDDNKNNIPHSVYELNGAKECAIEFRSFSKSAGFTGLRCGYTVVPKNLVREKINLNKLWTRRQCTKTNGVSYVVQRGAQAVFSSDGKKDCMENVRYYMENAKIIFDGLKNIGFKVFGGQDAPYIWFEIPEKYSCWEWFDFLLNNFGIVGTPGIGFGKNGERYFRFSAFGKREDVLLGVDRLKIYI